MSGVSKGTEGGDQLDGRRLKGKAADVERQEELRHDEARYDSDEDGRVGMDS